MVGKIRLCLILLILTCSFGACKKEKPRKNDVPETVIPETDVPSELQQTMVSTIAGDVKRGNADGKGLSARFHSPSGICIDVNGNVYVADYHNHAIRKITREGDVTTLAGGIAGDTELTSTAFNGPMGVTIDSKGNLYVADDNNQKVKRIAAEGTIQVIAGSKQGELDGPLGTNKLNYPYAVAIDESTGSIYVSQFTSYVKRIKNGVVETLAGGIKYNYEDAAFKFPLGIVINAEKELIVSDYGKNQIFKINAKGEVLLIAGSGVAGALDGQASEATFNLPHGLAIDKEGNIYVADRGNNKIRKISTAGVVTTVAGNGALGIVDGPANLASFNEPTGLAIDLDGNLLVTDRGNHQIRKITFKK